MGTLVGGRPEGVRLSRTVWGRPYAPDLPGLDFSLSHTGSFLVAAVVRDGRIGVDAERSGRVMSVLEHRICTPYERAAFATRVLSGAGRDRELLRLWTLKEAYTKALGTGLRQAPRSFGLDDDDPVGRPVLRDSDGTALTGGLTTVTHTMPWGPGAGVLVSVVAGHRSSPTPGPSREPVRFEPVSSR
nr:4'-phosphopantetheinyl transferase superfamily protein [Streptomyces sp. LaPpAH-108]